MNKIKPFGIRKKDLQNLDYYGLKAAFYGLHNLDIPTEMLSNENPDEIAAKYIAAYILKRNNSHLRKSFSEKPNYDLFDGYPSYRRWYKPVALLDQFQIYFWV